MSESTAGLAKTALSKLEQFMAVIGEKKKLSIFKRRSHETETIAVNARNSVNDLKQAVEKDVRLDPDIISEDMEVIDTFLKSIGAIVVGKDINTSYSDIVKVHDVISDILNKLESE